MKMMVLSNPRLAALITMAALVVLGAVIGYVIARLSYSRMLKHKIDGISQAAIKARDETISILRMTLAEHESDLSRRESQLSEISLFLGKAITAIGVK